MKYEIGQKVETPLGVGILYTTQTINGFVTYKVEFEKTKLNFLASFVEEELKPYKTPHEKLLDMGFEVYINDDYSAIYFNNTTYQFVKIDKQFKTYQSYWEDEACDYNPHFITLELSRIITEYLEWLEEEK